jgi:extracellular factor (EF) 3-hydroxypalmitic acid methyl ester biosynthesis protein
MARNPVDPIARAAAFSHGLMLALAQSSMAGWSREQMREAVAPARGAYGASPFANRLQTWPRGYPGDFETVEYILDHQNRAEPGTFAYGLEQVALDSPIAEQHRNKVRTQAQAILQAAVEHRDRPGGARVLVLASGGAADVRMVEDELVELDTQVVLLDQDADALAFARARLPRLAPNVTTVCRNVIRGLVAVRALGPFDLVVAGGLFDYLPDQIVTRVLQQARERLLTPSGRVLFTNIAIENPFRLWIECLADWKLIHRSAGDLKRLCADAGYGADEVVIEADPTALALIATCQVEAVDAVDREHCPSPVMP